MKSNLIRCFTILSWFALFACGDSPKAPKTLRVGFVPAEDAQQVMQNAQPVVEILRKELGMEIQPFVATDYTGVVEALRVGKLDVAFLAPASYVLAKSEANVKVVLKSERKGIPTYFAAIITRADSGIKTLEDLRGKTFAFGDSLSTTGHVFPRKMFKERGIDPVRDFKQILYSGGHDATVLAVLNRKVDAGATYANSPDSQDTAWMRYLKDPADIKKIHAIAFSEPIPADNLVIRGDLDDAIAKKIVDVFINLSRDPAGKQMLRELYQIDGFVTATDKDYDSVREAFKIAGIPLKEALKKKEIVTILEITDLQQSYSAIAPVLRGISLKIEQGEFVGIIGLSGSGKSTLLRCINRLVDATAGEIIVPASIVDSTSNGKPNDILKLNGTHLRYVRRKIGMIFQQFNIVKRLSVIENVLSGGLGYQPSVKSTLRIFSHEEQRRALVNLKRVGLLEHAYKRADELSGGEQQRVAIARTLMQRPAIILADEPVSSLDPKLSRVVLDILKRVCREDGITALVSLHTLELTREYADRVVGLKDGQVIFDGPTHELTESIVDAIYQRGD